MLDWLEKKLLPPNQSRRRPLVPRGQPYPPKNKLPALIDPEKIDRMTAFLSPLIPSAGQMPAELPNATIIYAVGAAALFTVALFHLFTGDWVVGLLLFLPAGVLMGFALHYLRYHD